MIVITISYIKETFMKVTKGTNNKEQSSQTSVGQGLHVKNGGKEYSENSIFKIFRLETANATSE